MAEARKTVDGLDKEAGIRDRDPRTICTALEVGLKNPATNAHYDALVMLEDLCSELNAMRRKVNAAKN